MSDDPEYRRALLHGAPQAPPRQRSPGEEIWRMRLPDDRVHVCEVRNDATVGAGWDLQIFDGPELLVSPRSDSEEHARRVADMAKGDYLRQACVAIEKGGVLKH
jgi:hypothetical protein